MFAPPPISEPQQQLYVRLFLRKHHWIRASKLSYKDIAADLQHVIDGLVAMKFLMNGKPDFKGSLKCNINCGSEIIFAIEQHGALFCMFPVSAHENMLFMQTAN